MKELSLAASRLSIAATSGTSASMSTSTSTSTSTSAAGTGAGAGSLPSASDMTRLVESLRQVLERADDMDRSILERKAATADELEATVASLKRGLASAEESLAAERAELSALSTRLHEKLSGTVDQFTKLLPRSGKLDMVAPSALESMEESFKTAFEKEMEVMSRAYRMQIIKLQQEKAKLELELRTYFVASCGNMSINFAYYVYSLLSPNFFSLSARPFPFPILLHLLCRKTNPRCC